MHGTSMLRSISIFNRIHYPSNPMFNCMCVDKHFKVMFTLRITFMYIIDMLPVAWQATHLVRLSYCMNYAGVTDG